MEIPKDDMKHASLFTGFGGFDLAAAWMGWHNVFQVEIDPFCQQILKYHFPNAQRFTDIRKFDGKPFKGAIDVLSGGFPCQPYSTAGKRKGKDDDRHLWPEMLRIIQEVSPRWVVGENVRGLVSWNGGLVFQEVQADLEAEGYEVQPFILPAASIGAPHIRERVLFIANSKGITKRKSPNQINPKPTGRETWIEPCGRNINEFSTYAGSVGFKRSQQDTGNETGAAVTLPNIELRTGNAWQNFPAQPPLCGGNDGLPARLDGITFSKWRTESLKGYGNAVVPQLAYLIFKAIEQYQNKVH